MCAGFLHLASQCFYPHRCRQPASAVLYALVLPVAESRAAAPFRQTRNQRSPRRVSCRIDATANTFFLYRRVTWATAKLAVSYFRYSARLRATNGWLTNHQCIGRYTHWAVFMASTNCSSRASVDKFPDFEEGYQLHRISKTLRQLGRAVIRQVTQNEDYNHLSFGTARINGRYRKLSKGNLRHDFEINQNDHFD